jgi:hypothetical protein
MYGVYLLVLVLAALPSVPLLLFRRPERHKHEAADGVNLQLHNVMQ